MSFHNSYRKWAELRESYQLHSGGILWLQRGHFCVVLASIHSRSLSFGTTMGLPIFSAGKPSL